MAWNTDLDPASVAYKIAAADEARVRVIAGPGTGKSFAMKRRVARLLESGVDPTRVLAVTFTRVAAEDLHRELQKLGVAGCEELKGQTLHSLAMRILGRKHVLETLGRHARPLNRFEMKALVADLANAVGGKNACKKLIDNYQAAWAQSQGDDPGFAKDQTEAIFEKALIDWMMFHRSMLIGEVVPYLVKYLKHNPAAPEHSEFSHLLIDEYQDLNKAEQSALAYLGEKAAVCVVGDDDQSIYSFKSAYPDGIRQWKDVHPGCADLAMSDCHRCPIAVVDMANSLIAHNKHRTERELVAIKEKGPGVVEIVQLKNPDAEAEWIASKVAEMVTAGVAPSDVIILAQRARISKRIIEALRAKAVPAKSYYDESQLDSESAQSRFSLLKLILDKDDRVALRYLLGVGSTDYRAGAYARLRAYCEANGQSTWQALDLLASGLVKLPYVGPLIEAFKAVKTDIETLEALKTDIPALIDALFPDGNADVSDLRFLALTIAENDEVKSLEDLFAGMMEEITQPDVPPTIEDVRVMSLHKSKGLSSPVVFIASCVQGVLPQAPDDGTPPAEIEAKLEEARRLFFVGITRVKAEPAEGKPGALYLTYPVEMNAGAASGAKIAFKKVLYGQAQLQPSLFMGELGKSAPHPKAG